MKIAILLSLLISLSHGQEKLNRSDFDFYFGKWKVFNKRQMDDGKWISFEAKVEAIKTLNGLGNVDIFEAMIEGELFSGMTMRLYNKETDEWIIKWYDSDNPAKESTPSIGKFENGNGKFYKTITTEKGRAVTVRFLWYDIKKNSFNWESSWSIDNENWNPTWKMAFTRVNK